MKGPYIAGWVVRDADFNVYSRTFGTDLERVRESATAVAILNKLKANTVYIVPAQLVVNVEDQGQVLNEDPFYFDKLKAANLAKKKTRGRRTHATRSPRS